MYTLIGLGVVFIAALVVAYLSTKTWHWGQVIVVFLVFVASVGYGVLAADVLRKHHQVRSEYNDVTTELVRLTAQNEALLKGSRDSSVYGPLAADGIEPDGDQLTGIRDLQARLGDINRARGPVWRNVVRPSPPNPQTGAVTITSLAPPPPPPADAFAAAPTEPPSPPAPPLAGLKQGTIVFAFEQNPPSGQPLGQYLGEFQVTQRNGPQAVIEPVLRQSWAWPRGAQVDSRILRMANSQVPWVLYETMPTDRHDAFEGLSGDQLRAVLPPDAVDEYLRHGEIVGDEVDLHLKAPYDKDGTPLTEEKLADVPATDVEWRFERPLRDYSLLFQILARQRIEQFAEHDALQTDIRLLEAAQQSAESLQTARQAEIGKLQHDLTGFFKEADFIEEYAGLLQQRLQAVVAELQRKETTNQELVAELAEAQLNVIQALQETGAAP